jgi:hypothetical protein
MGFRVLLVPEAATVMRKGGAMIQTGEMKFADAVRFQQNLMRLQMNLEDIFIEIAQTSDMHTIIIMDRGTMDGSAYTEEHVWQAILDETGWSTIQLRDRRYEAVIHMMTAAEGAEEFYSSENNNARYEGLEEARQIDQKLINAWVGHPHFSIIKNTKKGFKTKIEYCVRKCLQTIGMPQPTSMTKKFLLAVDKRNTELNIPAEIKREIFKLDETFIKTSVGESNMLRKIGKNDSYTYSHEMRYEIKGEKIQKKRGIHAREYIELLDKRDEKKRNVLKSRQCFIYERQYFTVETFENLEPFPSILRVETTKDN